MEFLMLLVATMFNGCNNFNQDISSWNVANVTTMNYCFNAANNFNQDISKWNISNKVWNFVS